MKFFNDGGPAFPITSSAYDKDIADGNDCEIVQFGMGMSIRDYFAAHALQGLLANSSLKTEILNQRKDGNSHWVEASAWIYADKMISLQHKEEL
jgi:hypothetical protein